MKKMFLALTLMLTFCVSAQVTGPKLTYAAVGNLLSEPTHAATDTITNTTVKYQYGIVNGSNVHFTIQANLTKISGTVAGTVKPQGSVDGVTYMDIAGQTAFTLTDVGSQSCVFVIAPSAFQYYRVVVTPSGTQSTKISSLGLVRRYN
jgi:hypothetical protein